MKKIILFFFCCSLYQMLQAQQKETYNSEVKIKELAVPKSPAFNLLDISPTQIETPTSPKQFALDIAQSFKDSIGWPKNYSMEFAPYWWLKKSNRSVYDFLGLRTINDSTNENTKKITGENPFSGLKFTSISMAFINEDLIPDSIKRSQKIFSAGIHSTIIKIHSKNYAKLLASKLKEWHDAAQLELDMAMSNDSLPADPLSPAFTAYWQKFTDMKLTTTSEIFDDINDIMNEKPVLSLDISAAYANYGINDSTRKTGRTGLWVTLSSYVPIKLDDDEVNKNYIAFFGYLRYLQNNYAPGKGNQTMKSSCFDIGGKFELKFDKLSIGYEIIHRNYTKKGIAANNRNVGVVSYQLGNNLYINGAFGKDFGITNKQISSLGINWGFGDEKTKL
jgi:hypothetical protein